MSSGSEIKLALLGDDPRAMPLLRAWLDELPRPDKLAKAQLVAAIFAPNCVEQLHREGHSAALATNLDSLFEGSPPDAVIVAGEDPQLLESARLLATAGAALLVLPLTGLTTAFAYELTLLQTDTPVVLYPLFTWRGHPLVQRVQALLSRGALGTVQHLQLERHVRQANTTSGLSTPVVTAAFLEDVDLLRLLVGEIANVTALRSGIPDGDVLLQSVSLGTRPQPNVSDLPAGKVNHPVRDIAGPKASWSIATGPEEDTWRLTIAGSAGRVVLQGVATDHKLTLDVTGVAGENSPATVTEDPGKWWRETFDELRTKPAEQRADAWTDFTRAYEVLEGIERSLRRRRTIDLEFELPSEQSQFKTHMTAAGCSLLLVTLFAVVVYLVVMQAFFPAPRGQRERGAAMSAEEQEVFQQQLQSRERAQRIVITVIFLPLGIFLGLQMLLLVARPAGRKTSGVPPGNDNTSSLNEKGRRLSKPPS